MRCFIALPINIETANKLEQISQVLQTQPWANNVHWFPKENYHLTLQFVGSNVSTSKVKQIIDSMDDWFSEGMSFFEAEIRQIKTFPTAKNPHTIIASLDATIMLQYLVREIEDHLKPIGLERNKLAFRPHISLGRIKPKADASQISIPNQLTNPENTWLTVDTITLFQSELTDKSPIYKPLKSIHLEYYD